MAFLRSYRWILAVGIVAAVAAYFLGAGRDESRIKKRFRGLVATMEKRGSEGALAASGKALRVSAFFVEEPVFTVAGVAQGSRARRELDGLVFQARREVDRLAITISDLRVEVGPDRLEAILTCTAQADVVRYGDRERDVREVRVAWRKDADEGWLIARVETVEGVRRVGVPGPDG